MSEPIDLHHHRIFAGLELAETLFSASTVGLALLDGESRFVWVNQTLAEMTGVSPDMHEGRRVADVVPSLAGELVPAVRKVMSSGAPIIDRELRGETAALPGQVRYWLTNLYPLRDGAAIVGVGAVVLDITERKATEHRLMDAEQHASELLHNLQGALVPRARIDERWQIAWRYRASENTMLLGGDFLGILDRPDGSLTLVIGDVAGRGAGAAGFGATLRSGWLALVHGGTPLEEIPVALDTLLKAQTGGGGMFATACFVEVNRAGTSMRIISAGHEAPLLITSLAASPVAIETGPALGLGPLHGWPQNEIEVHSPASVLLFTDGLTDSHHDRESPRLGTAGLVASIDAPRIVFEPPQQALEHLLQATLPGGIHGLDDDLAVILLTLD